jgi:CDP-diacylglycerol pyrophosphatase
MKKREELCAAFIMEDENGELKKLVVTQEIHPHYRKEEDYSKKFRLDSPDGPVVYQTENPDVFQLFDGTILKRRKR